MRNKQKTKIQTKRLNLYPLTDEEIKELINGIDDDGLKQVYAQMLDGCINYPAQRNWYAPWTMEQKKGKIRIGQLCFMGSPANDSVEIGYGIKKEYEGQGYTCEAAKALTDWAFQSEEVFFVEAEAEATNSASIHILEKLGFQRYGQGEEGLRFVKEKPATSFTSVWMCIGLCLGLSVGMTAFDNMSMGMCIGLTLGLALGASLDRKSKAEMDAARKRREELKK